MPLHPSMLPTFGSITTTQTTVLRQSYRVLMIAFLLFVITAALPLKPGSQVWGHQFSSAILNVAVLPWLALALGLFGVSLQQREQLEARSAAARSPSSAAADGDSDQPLAEDDDLRFLARLGYYSMLLLAVWQLVLFTGSLRQIDARQVMTSQAIEQRFGVLQERLRELPPANLPQALRQLGLGAPTADEPEDPFERLESSRDQVMQQDSRDANQARFLLSRESLRNLLLALLYATGFYGLARS